MIIKKIQIEVVPHSSQRYPIVGDYQEQDGMTKIRISDFGNDDYHFALLMHELWEWYLLMKSGKTIDEVDKFEIDFIKKFPEMDPDNDKGSPCHIPAQYAMGFERLAMAILGIDQLEYDKAIDKMYEGR